MLPTKRLSSIAVALAIAAVAASISPASASPSAPPVAVLEDCRERAVVVPGVEALVRRRVPAQFELVRDPFGRPLLAVVGSRCERYTVGGTTRPTTFAFFVAIIESPDGGGCGSRWPLVGAVKPDLLALCNFYGLYAVYDNPAVPEAVRALVPDFPIYHVPNVGFEAEELGLTRLGVPFRFRAGPPTPSPFELDAIVREGTELGPLTISFWFNGASGTVKFSFEIADIAVGQMDAAARAAPGSEMAELLGTQTPTPITGLAIRYKRAEATFVPPESVGCVIQWGQAANPARGTPCARAAGAAGAVPCPDDGERRSGARAGAGGDRAPRAKDGAHRFTGPRSDQLLPDGPGEVPQAERDEAGLPQRPRAGNRPTANRKATRAPLQVQRDAEVSARV